MEIEKSPYLQKFWYKSYDPEINPELDVEVKSLADSLRESVRDYPDSICYEFMGTTSTYRDFEKNVISFANFLIDKGLKKGDKIAINLPNCPQFIIALYGAFYVGCVVSGINFLLKPNEVIYQLSDCDASAILTMDSFYEETIRKALNTGKTSVKLVITTNILHFYNTREVQPVLQKERC
ncbi:MAG: AMP-binding protein [Candidatus Lokiarchaeota archaeon]